METAVLTNQPSELAGSARLRVDEKSTGDRNSLAVKNLPIRVTSQGASSSGISVLGTSSSSKPMEKASISDISPQEASNSSKI
jgi:hypothetical protein